jgi:glycerol-3-phosphate dehydrogenase (NAD(P)+)
MKVGIIGAGAWGTALAISSARARNTVTLWSHDWIPHAGENRASPYLDGVLVPDDVRLTDALADMAGMEIWLVAVPAAFFRETIQKAREFWRGSPIIICTKGMEPNSHQFMSEIIFEEMPEIENRGLVGVLSGPQFAGEVARGAPTGSTLAATNGALARGKTALGDLHLDETDDIIGAQICGVGKNAVAMLMGYLDGMGAGENEKALNVTLAWNEIVAFGRYFGAKTETFLKLCGMGDLFLSATSRTSRNFSAGGRLARGESIDGQTVEGIFALRGLMARGREAGIRMPVLAGFKEIIG